MSSIAEKICNGRMIEYLIKRQLADLHTADSDIEEIVTIASLPVSQKPLRKGYNFFKSGQVSEVKFNKAGDVVHTRGNESSSICFSCVKVCLSCTLYFLSFSFFFFYSSWWHGMAA